MCCGICTNHCEQQRTVKPVQCTSPHTCNENNNNHFRISNDNSNDSFGFRSGIPGWSSSPQGSEWPSRTMSCLTLTDLRTRGLPGGWQPPPRNPTDSNQSNVSWIATTPAKSTNGFDWDLGECGGRVSTLKSLFCSWAVCVFVTPLWNLLASYLLPPFLPLDHFWKVLTTVTDNCFRFLQPGSHWFVIHSSACSY